MLNKNRIGKIYISVDVVEDENFSNILGRIGFVPLRVECLAYNRMFEYIGYSPHFDIISEAVHPPVYNIQIDTDDLLTHTVKVCLDHY